MPQENGWEMPIRPENKALYPSNWKTEIRPRIQKRAGDKCELCGVENHAVGVRNPTTKVFWKVGTLPASKWILNGEKVIRIVCTVMHLNHDPTDNRDENLKFGCQKCHNNYDAKFRAENRKKSKLVNPQTQE